MPDELTLHEQWMAADRAKQAEAVYQAKLRKTIGDRLYTLLGFTQEEWDKSRQYA